MRFIGTTFLGALLTLLRMLTGFVVTKFVAVSVGPNGVALLGQLQSFVAGVNGLIANQIGQGVVRFTAEHVNSGYETTKEWWSAATSLLIMTVSVSSIGIILMSEYLSLWLFNNKALYWLLIVVGLSLPFNAMNSIFLGVLNGLNENKKNIFISMISVCFTTTVTIFFLYVWGLNGGLFAVAINNGIAAVVVIVKVYRLPWFKFRYWFAQVDNGKKKIFVGYMLMGVVGALTGPTAIITIRNMISSTISIDATGMWQAVTRISDAYLAMFTIGIGLYYFPKAAAIKISCELKKETRFVIISLIPLLFAAVSCIFYFRDFIIHLLYSDDFYSARELFLPQLIGDVFRLLSFVPASILLARGYFKLNALAEVIINILFVSFSYMLLQQDYGLVSVNIAYALVYLFYLTFSVCFFFYHCHQLKTVECCK
ncbi:MULTISPECIES: O-antigen translocase [Aeromonas]|uniref:O-antigen translocase n=1 Tax=Aeromonas TaxID=642 RepID=UPI00148AE42B|nr:O-antigen translocase [Aeromonas media]QJT27075.1 O-antigen translocase [Aeromonas media]